MNLYSNQVDFKTLNAKTYQLVQSKDENQKKKQQVEFGLPALAKEKGKNVPNICFFLTVFLKIIAP